MVPAFFDAIFAMSRYQVLLVECIFETKLMVLSRQLAAPGRHKLDNRFLLPLA